MRDKILRGLARGVLASKSVSRMIGRKRLHTDAPGLDPQVAAVVELQRLLKLPGLETMTPVRARTFAAEGLSPLDLDPTPMARVDDIAIPGRAGPIPVRCYVPANAGPHWIVYFHGGGGVIGSIASSDPATRRIAALTKCTVASVDYRLGPEHRHPAAIDDSCDAFQYLAKRAPAGARVAVAGDSFGGYLAAQVDHACRVRGVRPPDVQGLIYPIVDMTLTSPSIARYADGFLLTRATMLWFRENYLNPSDDRRAASPCFWPDLHHHAPAVIATAEFDPLVDEGDEYARQLSAVGVPVRHRRYPGLVHGFLSLAGAVEAARVAVDQVCLDLAEMLA